MRRGALLLAAAAAIGGAGAAQAQEPFTWTGFYIGAKAGYIWGNVDADSGVGDADANPEGFLLGGQAGYDYQLPGSNIVLGAFVAAPVLFADDEETVVGLDVEAELDWAVTIAARAGYAFGDLLPYVMAGYTMGEGTGSVDGGGIDQEITESHDGYLVGLGADLRLDENFAVGFGWTYTDLSEETYNFPVPVSAGFDGNAIFLKADFRF
jgi:outer membrane immunogenic protein